MYNSENVQWFSQVLMTYKDKTYATEGYLRLSLSTNTEDYRFFNQPTINISITNTYQKSINLNIQNAKDLLRAFKSVLSQLNGSELNIQRKYQKDTILHFTFKMDQNDNRIVVVEIRNNETDFTKIVIPLESVFESFATCIREFTEQYMNICTQLFIQSVNSQSVQIIHQLPSLIKSISSQIVSQIPEQNLLSESRAPEPNKETVAETQATINDLDKFLGEDFSNVFIPEIDEKPKAETLVEVNSIFVNEYLENDLTRLESIMSNAFMSDAPLLTFLSNLKDYMKNKVSDENFTMLPGISEKDLKSLVYLSKLVPTVMYQGYLNSSDPLPSSTPLLKYGIKEFTDDNLNIAYDLFLINSYIRIVRRRLENKTSDVIQSKALFHIQLRNFTDPVVFSILDKVDKSKLTSIILTRYKYYNSLGFFDYYHNELKSKGCPEILESDILSAVDEAVEKIIGQTAYVNILHDNLASKNSFRISSQNSYTLEQIINEILPLEIAERTGRDLNSDIVIDEIKQKHPISDSILKIFTKKKTDKKTNKKDTTSNESKAEDTKTSNLERLIRTQFIDEVPEKYRDSFLSFLLNLGNNPYDFKNDKFPIDEFGDNVVKALYLWDPINDSVISKNYKQFFLKVEQEIMQKDLILTKVKSVKTEDPKEVTESNDWNFFNMS